METDHNESLVAVLFMQGLQLFAPWCQPAFAGDIHNQQHLAFVLRQVDFFAFDALSLLQSLIRPAAITAPAEKHATDIATATARQNFISDLQGLTTDGC